MTAVAFHDMGDIRLDAHPQSKHPPMSVFVIKMYALDAIVIY